MRAQKHRVWLEIEKATPGLRAAKANVVAAHEVVVNARERLKLAEGRYETGVGAILELQDAQLALSRAESQDAAAHFQVQLARVDLLQALSRD